MREPTKCDYIYVDDNNGVHVLVPIVGGMTVGLDNTCELRGEITRFTSGPYDTRGRRNPSIHGVLEGYAQALRDDIQELRGDASVAPLLAQKEERLTQIDGYLEFVRNTFFTLNYALFDEMVSKCTTNAVSIHLRPTHMDRCTTLNNPVFRLSRDDNNNMWGGVNLNETLKSVFSRARTREDARTQILNKAAGQTQSNMRGEALLTHLQQILPAILQEYGKEQVDLTKPIHEVPGIDTVNYQYLSEFIGTVANDTTAKGMAEELLSACVSDDYWNSSSPFDDMERAQPGQRNQEERHESLSLKVQFFIGQACAYAHAFGLTNKSNAGQAIENNSTLKNAFATAASNAWSSGGSVEMALHKVISDNYRNLGFNRVLTKKQQDEVTELFSANYNTIKGINHKDEFLLFIPGAPGNVVIHQNRISMHLVDALNGTVLNRLTWQERQTYQNHQNRWLNQRYNHFRSVQGQILPVNNEENLGELPELPNAEPLSVFTAQLEQVVTSSLSEANTPQAITTAINQLNAEIEAIGQGIVRRAEQAKLRQACQTKRDEIQRIANDRRTRLERQVKEQAAEAMRQRFEELENSSEAHKTDINAANNAHELSQVVARLLQQIPTDAEINEIDDEWRQEFELSSDMMRAVINSLQDAKTEELNPTLRLERALNRIDLVELLTCDNEDALETVQVALEAQLQELTKQAEKLGDAGQQFIRQIQQSSENIENLVDEQCEALERQAKIAADKVKVQAVINTLDDIKLNVTDTDSKTELKDKLVEAEAELDKVLENAKETLEDIDLLDLEYEIEIRKGLFSSEVALKQQAILEKECIEAQKDSLCQEVALLSFNVLHRTQNLKDFFAEKQSLNVEFRRIEKEADFLPDAAKATVMTALRRKNRELEEAIKVKEQAQPISSLLDTLNQRYMAIGQVINAQLGKIRGEQQDSWYALFNAKSADKANAIHSAINNMAHTCLMAKHGDIAHRGQAEQDALLTAVSQSAEFKKSILAAWDDKSSELYQALNSKRLSFWGHSFTLFSGQSWSHCMDGDSATVKAIKAVDTFEIEDSNTGPSL